MTEELQTLLDRIERDGVKKAEAQRDQILAEARADAERLREEARKDADMARSQAKRDADAEAERGRRALHQAARDVVLSVGESVRRLLHKLVLEDTGKALSAERLADMLVDIVGAYAKQAHEHVSLHVLTSATQQKALAAHFRNRLAASIADGVVIEDHQGIGSGFRVAVKEKNIEHDFTGEAIAESLCELLRPQLAAIVREALPK